MIAIRFTDSRKVEDGLRLVFLNGTVEFTDREEVIKVPHWILSELEKEQIPYERVEYQSEANVSGLVSSSMIFHP